MYLNNKLNPICLAWFVRFFCLAGSFFFSCCIDRRLSYHFGWKTGKNVFTLNIRKQNDWYKSCLRAHIDLASSFSILIAHKIFCSNTSRLLSNNSIYLVIWFNEDSIDKKKEFLDEKKFQAKNSEFFLLKKCQKCKNIDPEYIEWTKQK